MNIINLDLEIKQLIDLIKSLWNGCDNDDATGAIKLAFQLGLDDGKLWIDENSVMRIAEVLNGNDEVCYPLEARNEMTFEGKKEYLHDALCLFDNHLSACLSDIYGSLTRYGRWDYSKRASEVCERIVSDFGQIDVSPKEMDQSALKELLENYPGYDGRECRTQSTPERLSHGKAVYNKESQGISFFRSMFGAVYSHGLYCARTKNTQQLINDLLPIYKKRDEPLNFDNSEEIMAIAMKNPFVKLIQTMKPFEFSSMEKYRDEEARIKHYQATKTAETEAKQKARMKQDFDAMMINYDERIEEQNRKTDQFIDSYAKNVESFKLAA